MTAPRWYVHASLAAVCVLALVGRVPAEIAPENVLVLYNEASAEGTTVAGYYSQMHPGVQLLGLANVGLGEEITADDYLSIIHPQVMAALTPSIDIIVTTKGLPLRIENTHPNPTAGTGSYTYTDPFGVARTIYGSTWQKYSSLESELAQIDKVSMWEQMGDQTWWLPPSHPDYPHHSRNLYYLERVGFDHEVYGSRLTSRLDGFTVADITASIDRAQQAFCGPYCFVVDNDPNAPGATLNRMPALADVLDAADMPHTYDNTDTFITDAPGLVLGYVSYGVHGGGEPAPDGYLVDEVNGLTFDLADGAVFHTWESYNTYSFAEGGNRSGQGLVAEWIARGGTVGTGHVEEPGANPTNVTNEDVMFEMLLDGYTWAEAAWSATQQLSFVNTVVGDPLMVFRELIPGDANKDGKVDIADLLALGDNWDEDGEPGGAMWGQGDFNGDGVIDIADLLALGDNWDRTTEWYDDGRGQVVPEPSALILAIAGMVTLFGCVWRRRGKSSARSSCSVKL